MVSEETRAVCDVLNRFERQILRELGLNYDRLPLGIFLDGMAEALVRVDVNPIRFLEVGCGIGTKVLLAQALDSRIKAQGIERERGLARAGIELGIDICIADALQWLDYADYDLIYCWRLFLEDEPERRLEERIRTYMKPGAWFLCFGLGPRLWQKS